MKRAIIILTAVLFLLPCMTAFAAETPQDMTVLFNLDDVSDRSIAAEQWGQLPEDYGTFVMKDGRFTVEKADCFTTMYGYTMQSKPLIDLKDVSRADYVGFYVENNTKLEQLVGFCLIGGSGYRAGMFRLTRYAEVWLYDTDGYTHRGYVDNDMCAYVPAGFKGWLYTAVEGLENYWNSNNLFEKGADTFATPGFRFKGLTVAEGESLVLDDVFIIGSTAANGNAPAFKGEATPYPTAPQYTRLPDEFFAATAAPTAAATAAAAPAAQAVDWWVWATVGVVLATAVAVVIIIRKGGRK